MSLYVAVGKHVAGWPAIHTCHFSTNRQVCIIGQWCLLQLFSNSFHWVGWPNPQHQLYTFLPNCPPSVHSDTRREGTQIATSIRPGYPALCRISLTTGIYTIISGQTMLIWFSDPPFHQWSSQRRALSRLMMIISPETHG